MIEFVTIRTRYQAMEWGDEWHQAWMRQADELFLKTHRIRALENDIILLCLEIEPTAGEAFKRAATILHGGLSTGEPGRQPRGDDSAAPNSASSANLPNPGKFADAA